VERFLKADRITLRLISDLAPYAKNARTHSPEQVEQLAASIREFGFTNPILVTPEGMIVAGHGRLEAAKLAGLEKVPTLTVGADWTPDQIRGYVLADNKLALNAGWDEALLAEELGELSDAGFNMGTIGFSQSELASIMSGVAGGLTDPDETPPIPVEPVSELGDVWILGNHRIICGDSTDADVARKLMGGVRPHLMVTDPPYGVKYDASWRQKAGVASPGAAVGKVLNDDRADWREAWALFPGSVAYIWHAGTFAGDVAASLIATKFKIRAQIVWVKTRHVLSRGDYHHQHEPCFYGVREGEDENWHFVPEHEIATYAVKQGQVGHYVGGRKQSTVWNIEHIKSDTGHSTQKPVECMKRPIENNSQAGDAVYEPFSGSGTTIIAGEMSGRRIYAIELNPAYVDVAVERWQNFTGKRATLESSGKTFDEVKALRRKH